MIEAWHFLTSKVCSKPKGMLMKLVQLIYYSEMTSKPEDILRDLKSILASARRHNTAMGISGLWHSATDIFCN
jgi:hypothetical protein